jgi:hypothetical protein
VQSKLGRRFIATFSLSASVAALFIRLPLPPRITTLSSSSSSESIGDDAGARKQHDNTRSANDGPAASTIRIAPDVVVSLPLEIRPLDRPSLVIIRVRSSSRSPFRALIDNVGTASSRYACARATFQLNHRALRREMAPCPDEAARDAVNFILPFVFGVVVGVSRRDRAPPAGF